MFNLKHFMLVTCCFLLPAQTLFPQIVLKGTVTDNGGEYLGSGAAPVTSVLVTVTDQADPSRTFSAHTDEQGQYNIQIAQTGVDDASSGNPDDFKLLQNYPNPFNPSTVIGYQLTHPSHIRIEIYNVLGQKIKTLLDRFEPSGSSQIIWDATDDMNQGVPAGLYIYSLKVGGVRINRKMVLIDGQQDVPGGGALKKIEMNVCSQTVIKKVMSDYYLLRITGTDIQTYEQPNLEITGNTTLDVTVIRTVTDIDGNIYKTVKIGNQWWMAENLKITHYRNGEAIPNITDAMEWQNLTTGAYFNYNYNNAPDSAATWFCLYNWYAVNDTRNIAPAGWHVPTDAEWKQLEMYLGMSQSEADDFGWRGTDEGGKLKEAGTSHWQSPNAGATNESGFSALPGGYHSLDGNFGYMGAYAHFWSSSEDSTYGAWSRLLNYDNSVVYRISSSKHYGFSIRLVRDH